MPYLNWKRIQYKLPNYDTKVFVTAVSNANTEKRVVTEAFLESTDAEGHHWVFGFDNKKMQVDYTVVAWAEKPEPKEKL